MTTLKRKEYPNLKETVYQTVLSNGLKVTLVPKKNYEKTFAVLTSDFGSLDRSFNLDNGSVLNIPAGTAHFLEHKLFDMPDGQDAFNFFGQHGADSNAFTNQNQTSYLFSTTKDLEINLNYLLDFVQTPYFTDQSVQKEQGIIGAEIDMYQDDVSWGLYQGLLEQMYTGQAMADDIAGTRESIAQITPELLYRIHELFYAPSHLTLKLVGGFDEERILQVIEANQSAKTFPSITEVATPILSVKNITVPSNQRQMAVTLPKLAIGFKSTKDLPSDIEGLKQVTALNIAADMLFGEQTDWYEKLYQDNLIDSDFSIEYDAGKNYQFLSMFAETADTTTLQSKIIDRISVAPQMIDRLQDTFASLVKANIGDIVQKMNSLEYIALNDSDALFGATVFDELAVLQSLTLDDVKAAFEQFMANSERSTFVVSPLEH